MGMALVKFNKYDFHIPYKTSPGYNFCMGIIYYPALTLKVEDKELSAHWSYKFAIFIHPLGANIFGTSPQRLYFYVSI